MYSEEKIKIYHSNIENSQISIITKEIFLFEPCMHHNLVQRNFDGMGFNGFIYHFYFT